MTGDGVYKVKSEGEQHYYGKITILIREKHNTRKFHTMYFLLLSIFLFLSEFKGITIILVGKLKDHVNSLLLKTHSFRGQHCEAVG